MTTAEPPNGWSSLKIYHLFDHFIAIHFPSCRFIIPKLLDPREYQAEADEVKEKYGMELRYVYDDAWRMSPAYHKFLRKYMATGKITDKPWHEPLEGFYQASVDTDPSKDYGDCSEFSLICRKTGSGVHMCTSSISTLARKGCFD